MNNEFLVTRAVIRYIIVTCDCLTREHYWRITSLETTKTSLFTVTHIHIYVLVVFGAEPWINHLPPACCPLWGNFDFEGQLVFKFGIMEIFFCFYFLFAPFHSSNITSFLRSTTEFPFSIDAILNLADIHHLSVGHQGPLWTVDLPPTKTYTMFVPIFAKRDIFSMGGANSWNEDRGEFSGRESAKFLKRAKNCMYLFTFVYSACLNCYAFILLCPPFIVMIMKPYFVQYVTYSSFFIGDIQIEYLELLGPGGDENNNELAIMPINETLSLSVGRQPPVITWTTYIKTWRPRIWPSFCRRQFQSISPLLR